MFPGCFRSIVTVRFDFPVPEQVARLAQFFGAPESRIVIRVKVVAIGAVEGIDVPEGGVIPRGNDFESLLIGG